MLGRLHEHCPGPDGRVREWAAEEQVRGRIHPRQQRLVHLHAEEESVTGHITELK